MKVLYIDCLNGISGDMFLSGLLDLGLPEELLKGKLNTLKISDWALTITKVKKQGINCTGISVNSGETHPHRNLSDINLIIDQSGLAGNEIDLAKRIFRRLAEAEAHVHGTSIDQIHFHEVGAVDAIIDICSAAIGVCYFNPSKIVCSPIPVGSGYIKCAHGIIPIPAPATVELLKGLPVYSNGMIGELVTPTGAAIASTISDEFGEMPPMNVERSGYGAGYKDFDVPNVVRLLLGSSSNVGSESLKKEKVTLIEFNVDDMNPEIISAVKDRLLSAGALDIWSQPAYMKKGRLGFIVSVLAECNSVEILSEVIFNETSTFGIRYIDYMRSILDRRWISVTTRYGIIKVKIGYRDGKIYTVSPEFEDCKRAADISNASIADVYEAAHAVGNKEALL